MGSNIESFQFTDDMQSLMTSFHNVGDVAMPPSLDCKTTDGTLLFKHKLCPTAPVHAGPNICGATRSRFPAEDTRFSIYSW